MSSKTYILRGLREQLISIQVEAESEDQLHTLIDKFAQEFKEDDPAVKEVKTLITYPEVYGVVIDNENPSR